MCDGTHTHRNHLCPHCLSHQCGHSWVSVVLVSDTLGSCNELYLKVWIISFRNLIESEINPRGLWTGLQRYFLEGLAERGRPSARARGSGGQLEGGLKGKLTLLPSCLCIFLPIHSDVSAAILPWHQNAASLTFECGQKSSVSLLLLQAFSTRLDLQRHPASWTEQRLGFPHPQYENTDCWDIETMSCQPIQ